MNPVHIILPYLFKIHFNIILLPTSTDSITKLLKIQTTNLMGLCPSTETNSCSATQEVLEKNRFNIYEGEADKSLAL
jgi:hypothetical protein